MFWTSERINIARFVKIIPQFLKRTNVVVLLTLISQSVVASIDGFLSWHRPVEWLVVVMDAHTRYEGTFPVIVSLGKVKINRRSEILFRQIALIWVVGKNVYSWYCGCVISIIIFSNKQPVISTFVTVSWHKGYIREVQPNYPDICLSYWVPSINRGAICIN
jgi:hypothetical protein